MWIRTHYFMARSIHEYIKEKYNVTLQLDRLQYGSVKPDLQRRYREKPHYYECCYSYWLDEVTQLLSDHKKRSVRNFSDKLGVILHFTADFFCSAHNLQGLKENLWDHMRYEMKLDQAFRQFEPFRRIQRLSCDDPYDVIERYRQSYLASPPSLERDIHYIYAASMSISDLLTAQVLLPTVKPLAIINSLAESS